MEREGAGEGRIKRLKFCVCITASTYSCLMHKDGAELESADGESDKLLKQDTDFEKERETEREIDGEGE